MHQTKESFSKAAVATSSSVSRQESRSKIDWFSKSKSKSSSIHFQSSSQLSPQEKYKRWSWSKLNFKAMLLYPLKIGSRATIGKSRTLKMILEGDRDLEDEKVVDSFRQMLFVEGQLPGKHNDYHTLLRFLQRRDFDLQKAKESFLEYIKWREEFGVDSIAKEFKFDEYSDVKRCYPHGYHGVDKYGRPLYIERIGMIDLNSFVQITSIDRFVKYHVSQQEKTLRLRYPACSIAAKKHIASTTSILDVKNVGISNFSKPARYLFLEIQKIDSSYYPETLHRLFIINAGPGFRVLWKTLKAFLDPRTLAKIQVLGSNYKSYLVEVIDSSNLPTFMGGNCSCSEFDGCLMSDKGPWNDPEISGLVQAMIDPEGDRNGEASGVAENKPLNSDLGDIGINDIFGNTLSDRRGLEEPMKTEPFSDKIQAFEAALKDAKTVLQGLTQRIEDMQRS